ncbi:MAG: hypothetical protein K9M45_13900, partial [Kiritimatiellales bacterium]|nr:hypothetical protein [Kiritimatiellales bacterium]
AIVDKNKTPKTAKVLVDSCTTASLEGKALIYQALARVGSDEAPAPVAAAKSDGEAFKALCKWPDANAVNPLLEIAADTNRPLNDHVQAMRSIARLVSAQKGDVPGGPVSVCNQAMKAARRVDEKKAIIGALGKVSNDNALKTVQSYFQDEELKEAAKAAEKSIQNGMKNAKGKKKRKK